MVKILTMILLTTFSSFSFARAFPQSPITFETLTVLSPALAEENGSCIHPSPDMLEKAKECLGQVPEQNKNAEDHCYGLVMEIGNKTMDCQKELINNPNNNELRKKCFELYKQYLEAQKNIEKCKQDVVARNLCEMMTLETCGK